MSALGVIESQREVCRRFGTEFRPVVQSDKIGIADGVKLGIQPINGLRHPPSAGVSGWYIWSGTELSTSPEFFSPLHVEHVPEWSPAVMKYLALPPGWRFLIADDYEDVWFDESLLSV